MEITIIEIGGFKQKVFLPVRNKRARRKVYKISRKKAERILFNEQMELISVTKR